MRTRPWLGDSLAAPGGNVTFEPGGKRAHHGFPPRSWSVEEPDPAMRLEPVAPTIRAHGDAAAIVGVGAKRRPVSLPHTKKRGGLDAVGIDPIARGKEVSGKRQEED